MIDLKELVTKAAKRGVLLYLRLERNGALIVRAERGMYRIEARLSRHGFSLPLYEQKLEADRLLEDLIYKLDRAVETEIETGGTK